MISIENLPSLECSGRIEMFAPKTKATMARHLHLVFLFADDCLKRASASEAAEERFNLAHNAACAFVETALLLKGYHLARQGDLDTVLEAMPLVLGEEFDGFTSYFLSCLQKREQDKFELYAFAPDVTLDEADELLNRVESFEKPILGWLEENGWWEATGG